MMSMAPLNKELPVPLYHQLKCVLMNAIKTGQLAPDEQLPNEGKLAEHFGISKITVRQAMQELANLGHVRRERGRGTFVSKPKLDMGPRELTSFSEEMYRHHLAASSRVVERFTIAATGRIAETLDLHSGEPVFVLKRLRMAESEPMGIQTAHIPLSLAPGLVEDDLQNASLYDILRNRYGLQPARATESYSAVPAEPIPAGLLKVAPGSPVFSVERITFLLSGKPFEFVQSIMRGDRYSINVELLANRIPQAVRKGGTQ